MRHVIARARLKLRSGDTMDIQVLPGFVEVRFYRELNLRHAEYIRGTQWKKFLKWACDEQNQPTGSSDPLESLRRDYAIEEDLAQQRRQRRAPRRRRRTSS